MPVVQEALWKHPGNPGMIVVTASASIREDGRLVMEHGPAQEASRRIRGIERQCAEMILNHAVDGVYGFLPIRPARPKEKIIGFGIFQTQLHWDECPDLGLIQHSVECLLRYTHQQRSLKIRMNHPNEGKDCLDVQEVTPLLTRLPESVLVCHSNRVMGPYGGPSGAGLSGTKELFIQVERWLREGRFNFAVEYLMDNGYDRQVALEQVTAVQDLLRAPAERFSSRDQNPVQARLL